MKNLCLSGLLLLLCGSGLFAQNFKTKQVAIFKDGTGFIVKSGNINAPNGHYLLKNVPNALNGSVWLSSSNGQVKSVRLSNEETQTKNDATTINQLLQANLNKRVRLHTYEQNERKIYEGKIIAVTKSVVTLQGTSGWQSIPQIKVELIEYLEKPNLQYETPDKQEQLNIEFAKAGNKKLNMVYLQKGMYWLPSYLVNLQSDTTAMLSLKAVVSNDVEDIEDAEMTFVSGVPNFNHRNKISPLVSNTSMRELIFDKIMPTSSGAMYNLQSRSGIDRYQRSSNIANFSSMEDEEFVVSEEEYVPESDAEEDLFFYKAPNVTLKKGERGMFYLLHQKINVEHVYEVILKANSTSSSYYKSLADKDSNPNLVWHSIKMKNTTSVPWTKASAFVLKSEDNKSRPISQDMLLYTPKGGTAFLKITISPDIAVNDEDFEMKREENAKKIKRVAYDLVTVSGKIKVHNFKDKPVSLSIKRNITGNLKKSNEEWTSTKLVSYSAESLNAHNRVKWEIDLKPGQKKTIEYQYEVYVR